MEDGMAIETIAQAMYELTKKNRVRFVKLLFVDINGTEKAVTVPIKEFEKKVRSEKWFDSSSIKGCGAIDNSDKMLKPNLKTLRVLPWFVGEHQNAVVLCDILTSDGKPFAGDPQQCLRRALEKAKGLGYRYIVGSEVEFFILKKDGSIWVPQDKAGYFASKALDEGEEMRQEMCTFLDKLDIEAQASHHEVADGQHEIAIKHAEAEDTAWNVLLLKMVISYVAEKRGYKATFMPKFEPGINGSGMHTHQSLWDYKGNNLFYNPRGRHQLSRLALQFMAGQLAHARECSLVFAPTVNSYKRLVPGYEAPVYVCWDSKNRSAMIRVPAMTPDELPHGVRIEFRAPDPSCNPFLAYAVMLDAGLRGIANETKPPRPLSRDAYTMKQKQRDRLNLEMLPGSLLEAIWLSSSETYTSVTVETLGPLYPILRELKLKEWDAFHAGQVTDWELETTR